MILEDQGCEGGGTNINKAVLYPTHLLVISVHM